MTYPRLKTPVTVIIFSLMCIGSPFAQAQSTTQPDACAAYPIKPTPETAGVADVSLLTEYDGPRVIEQDGVVIENKIINGSLKIDGAQNVIVRNSIIYGEGAFYALDITEGAQGVLIEDVEITDAKSAIVYIHNGAGGTLRRVHLHESEGDAMKTTGAQGVLVEASYFAPTIGSAEGAHADGNQTRAGGNNVTFLGNTIDMPIGEKGGPGDPYKSNANFIIQADAGNISNFHIECNWLNGGNYTVYFIQDKNNLGYVNANPRLLHNRFGRAYRFGVLNVDSDVPSPEICGNVWDDTGEAMDINTSTSCTDSVENPAQVSAPVISPGGGAWLEAVDVTLSTLTEDASIYYTLDGSEPTDQSLLYTAPFTVTTVTTVRAIAVRNDLTDSPIVDAVFDIGAFSSEMHWKNVAFAAQDASFTVAFDMTPLTAPIDGITALSAVAASAYTDLAAIVRFNPEGFIDARNGGSYLAEATLRYTAGERYHVRMEVDPVERRYTVAVAPEGGAEVVIAEGYAFRTEQQSVTALQFLSMYTNSGTHRIENVVVTEAPAATDIEQPLTFEAVLGNSYPNPFRDRVHIPYTVKMPGRVYIEVFNQLGQRVHVLVDGEHAPGTYTLTWDGRDAEGRLVSSGVYVFRMKAGQETWVMTGMHVR